MSWFNKEKEMNAQELEELKLQYEEIKKLDDDIRNLKERTIFLSEEEFDHLSLHMPFIQIAEKLLITSSTVPKEFNAFRFRTGKFTTTFMRGKNEQTK